MIPKKMDDYLRENLPEATLKNRLKKDNGKCYLEFTNVDEHLLSRLGIVSDRLGPQLVACMWDESSQLEIGGYLVVDNLSMGRPSMGGIRMLPDITPADIHNLARGMTLKNAAANLLMEVENLVLWLRRLSLMKSTTMLLAVLPV